MNLTDLRSTP